MKRLADVLFSTVALVFASPVLILAIIFIWTYDRHMPFYIAPRVGKGGNLFRMVKLRSMRVDADKSGVDSTSSRDPRITPVGKLIRRCKLDELTQLWNVLHGDMSLVGPRPNVERETRIYTTEEMRLLTVKPGITDFASIVFADEGDILKDQSDPDIAYNQLIRPWKSRLGLLYVENASFWLDFRVVLWTALAAISRPRALWFVHRELINLGAPANLVEIALRRKPLMPLPPPGSSEIVTSRNAA